jgi:drug/metabolite transporter (DMT)-like permease
MTCGIPSLCIARDARAPPDLGATTASLGDVGYDVTDMSIDTEKRTGGASGRSRDLGVLALVLLGPIWGYGWVATKVALGYSQPLTFAALRLVLTVVCLFLMLIATRRSLRPPPLGYTTVIGLLQTTAFVGLVMVALHSGGAGKVAVLTYTMPFWLLLLAWAFLGERLRGVQWLAVILALVGLVLVIAPWQMSGVTSSVLTLAGGLAWAAAALVVKLMQRKHRVDVLSLTTWQMAIGMVPLIVVAVLTYSGGPEWTAGFVWGLAYTVILANAVAWVLWLYALRTLSAGAAGLGTLAIPVVGVLAAWLQLGEVPSTVEAVGMVLIVGALGIIAARGLVAGRRQPAPADEEPVVQPVTD